MLALVAAIIFLLALLDVSAGDIELTTLGLLFVALHLTFQPWLGHWPWPRR